MISLTWRIKSKSA